MILPMDLAKHVAGCAYVPDLPPQGLDCVYGTASARLRRGRVRIAPQWRLPIPGIGVEYPGQHLVLMAQRRGEGIP
jgi:hypothetical protein